MDELLYKLLEQTPTIIVMGVGLFALWKQIIKKEEELVNERKENREMVERMTSEHKTETRETNEYIRDREAAFLEAIKNLNVVTTEIETKQQAIIDKQDSILLKAEEVLGRISNT